MPEKVLPTPEDMKKLGEALMQRGYRKLTAEEELHNVTKFKLRAPRPKKNERNNPSRKYIFISADGKYAVKIITSYTDDYPAGPNEKDSAKIVLVDLPTDTKIFKVTLNRTRFFPKRLYDFAFGLSQALQRLPVCDDPNCRCGLEILQPASFKDLPTYACPRRYNPNHLATEPQSILKLVLHGDHFSALERYGKNRERYVKKRTTEGKLVGTKENKRKPWGKTPPADMAGGGS